VCFPIEIEERVTDWSSTSYHVRHAGVPSLIDIAAFNGLLPNWGNSTRLSPLRSLIAGALPTLPASAVSLASLSDEPDRCVTPQRSHSLAFSLFKTPALTKN